MALPSELKLLVGDRLPDFDVPYIVATIEQDSEDVFFSEYFVFRANSEEVLSYRLISAEHTREFLERYSLDLVLQDTIAAAGAAIEAKAIESLPREEQYRWAAQVRYSLTEIPDAQLQHLWARGRLEKQLREVHRITRCRKLRSVLNTLFTYPKLSRREEKPATPPPG